MSVITSWFSGAKKPEPTTTEKVASAVTNSEVAKKAATAGAKIAQSASIVYNVSAEQVKKLPEYAAATKDAALANPRATIATGLIATMAVAYPVISWMMQVEEQSYMCSYTGYGC